MNGVLEDPRTLPGFEVSVTCKTVDAFTPESGAEIKKYKDITEEIIRKASVQAEHL